jgi:hypothetical protein
MLTALLLAALCTPLPVCSTDAPEPVALVQSVGADLGVTASARLALPASVTDGNAIIVAVRAGGHSSHALTASDSHGTRYTLAASVAAPGPSTLAMFYARDVAAGPLTVTVTDTATAGPIRMAVREYRGLGAATPVTVKNGSGSSVAALAGVSAMVTGNAVIAVIPEPDAPIESVTGKLHLAGMTDANLVTPTAWTSVSAFPATSSGPCETPTPVLTWDQSKHPKLAGYSIWTNEVGGVAQKDVDLPCEWLDYDEDGTSETRQCRGADVWYPLQRARNFDPGKAYEVRVTAYTSDGFVSEFSDPLIYCPRPLCAKPGPCS